MPKQIISALGALLILFSSPVRSDNPRKDAGPDIRLRFFEGIKEGTEETTGIITSSFLESTITANLESQENLAEERAQIRETFGLKNVRLLTEAVLKWPGKEANRVTHLLKLDGKQYMITLTAVDRSRKRQFRVEVIEQSGGEKRNLLDTEIILPAKNIAVFGFEDAQRKPYFLSLRIPPEGVIGGVAGGVIGGVEGGVSGGVEGGVEGGVVGGVRGGVAKGEESGAEVKPPKLIKKVNPIYPEVARTSGVQGVVILEVKTDVTGRVQDPKVLRSIPLLDQAAIDAVKQWVYEPTVVDGKPKESVLTVTVNFKLDEKDIEEFAKGAVKIKDAVPPPKLVKKVDPIYPEIARQSGAEGVVILQLRTDAEGRVKKTMVLRSIPLLDQAAIDAVRQWVYEPLVIDGQSKETVFTVTVRFQLKKEKEKAVNEEEKELERETGEVSESGEVRPPRIIKKVEPVYPKEARQAGIQGTVLLEAMTDNKGNVVKVKVLESIPGLDQAAIDALKQWKYEPVIIEGQPKSVVFTVAMRFRLR